MSAQVHYNGNVYYLADGNEGAASLEREVRATVGAGGGTVTIRTHTGEASLLISKDIPISIVAIDD